jgi:hypothetical protein
MAEPRRRPLQTNSVSGFFIYIFCGNDETIAARVTPLDNTQTANDESGGLRRISPREIHGTCEVDVSLASALVEFASTLLNMPVLCV